MVRLSSRIRTIFRVSAVIRPDRKVQGTVEAVFEPGRAHWTRRYDADKNCEWGEQPKNGSLCWLWQIWLRLAGDFILWLSNRKFAANRPTCWLLDNSSNESWWIRVYLVHGSALGELYCIYRNINFPSKKIGETLMAFARAFFLIETTWRTLKVIKRTHALTRILAKDQ